VIRVTVPPIEENGHSSEGKQMATTLKTLDTSSLGDEALDLKTHLQKRVIGQNPAVTEISNTYQMYLTGMHPPGRPIGSFLFLGPTGTGKTRTVEVTADALVKDSRAVVKIDCGEFQHSHEIAKLIGSPPGYLGHRETHPLLSQEVINQYHTDKVKLGFVLFDEIEKASDALRNLLLGILDKATLTLGDNRRVDFSQTMIFMTSNLGAREMNDVLRPKVGFNPVQQNHTASDFEAQAAKLTKTARQALQRKFTPEFVNRLDKIITFQPLGQPELKDILDLEFADIQDRAASRNHLIISPTAEAKAYILAEGTSPVYGARHLKRALERLVTQPLANLIATKQVRDGDVIRIDYDAAHPGALLFQRVEEEPPAAARPASALQRQSPKAFRAA
jgi:ATP-dependent Clp protease ATP-binding subunit ClpA